MSAEVIIPLKDKTDHKYFVLPYSFNNSNTRWKILVHVYIKYVLSWMNTRTSIKST